MASSLMMAMWQSDSGSDNHLLMIFVGLIAAAMLGQAVVVLFAALGAMRTQKKLAAVADELKASAVPFLLEARAVFAKSSDLIDEVAPAVRTISRNAQVASENVAIASDALRNKVLELDELTSEIQQRATVQVRRVDGIVTGGLTATAEIGAAVHRAILIPVREIMGLMNGFKAGVDSLMGRARDFGVIPGGRRSASRDEETRL